MIERLPDWEDRLNDAVAEFHEAEFQWGKVDCAMFVGRVAQAMTGKDFLKPFRGKYSCEKSAKKAVENIGKAKSLQALLGTMFPKIHIAEAKRGDIILTRGGNLALCWGMVALAVGESAEGEPGLIRVAREDWLKAWAVG